MLLDTPLCDFDWKAPDFSLEDPTGTVYSMQEALDGADALLIAFICNHCPYVKAIADRLSEDAALLKSHKIAVLAINSNDYMRYPEDAPKKMIDFASQHGFSFPYLVDEDQSVGRAYGAICTPDFFGLNKQGQLQYRGRLDDARMEVGAARTPELVNAMLQIAQTGNGPKEQTASMGCSIKWRES